MNNQKNISENNLIKRNFSEFDCSSKFSENKSHNFSLSTKKNSNDDKRMKKKIKNLETEKEKEIKNIYLTIKKNHSTINKKIVESLNKKKLNFEKNDFETAKTKIKKHKIILKQTKEEFQLAEEKKLKLNEKNKQIFFNRKFYIKNKFD